MKGLSAIYLLVASLLSLWLICLCQEDTAVYIVTMKQPPATHYYGGLKRFGSSRVSKGASDAFTTLNKPRNASKSNASYSSYFVRLQNSLLRRTLRRETYLKLYSYHYLVNGFAVLITPVQADKLSMRPEVANIVLDFSVRTATTYTPKFLGLPQGAWVQEGGPEVAGGVVIGFIDTGIDPTHPSFSGSLLELVISLLPL